VLARYLPAQLSSSSWQVGFWGLAVPLLPLPTQWRPYTWTIFHAFSCALIYSINLAFIQTCVCSATEYMPFPTVQTSFIWTPEEHGSHDTHTWWEMVTMKVRRRMTADTCLWVIRMPAGVCLWVIRSTIAGTCLWVTCRMTAGMCQWVTRMEAHDCSAWMLCYLFTFWLLMASCMQSLNLCESSFESLQICHWKTCMNAGLFFINSVS